MKNVYKLKHDANLKVPENTAVRQVGKHLFYTYKTFNTEEDLIDRFVMIDTDLNVHRVNITDIEWENHWKFITDNLEE